MRHSNNKRKFGRVKKVRNALINSLALNLIARGKIKTTLAKAKEMRPFVEKLVTSAKRGDIATRRLVISSLSNRRSEVKKLFEVIAPKYIDRKGGYTRILKLGPRISDGAQMAIIEFI
ncbi:50S ribosomal protein L17 [Candidatus Nomurabacteria bacterium RIFCSPHIGHO2_01_FULL_37_25]|uniref:Large ribosomal subunit protein bL17 n=1 Tax=Candidatus Nomurabacteria bacterium RIFCSPLOWO2_01_FULL_36_16 TaxID=1801767 RepID=A0A1F6WY30_9BACT|nr:MAG: 50S ribosomal protein L17 [Candidatus Nomurabacteria bacterium RIFCSPHIGHO2_01_FULL_37_25]OGI75127.1 MAG: 50S ribosomal protein L17 [Candidatus Nomurabacteria bacterium RIFCSPHIGHO2_02_FULL_36_29]OGI86782.1 MAG: 50S ribosomal protein L17 [Candidatus Nomurabacteria bacterium RIFCSPLOWO2_01_FULL_36_16]OGI96445.1 MAG: 50S ribosomal protein L17 [Candidatus Nomurabacteria bacterium RIFCSPLOWO2_02_FULL_36_8]